ncbi:MAG: ATP-binding protein [Vicinamibacterales bacterium]
MPNGIMLYGIMLFLNRDEELARLDAHATSPGGGLAVVFGRRRIGKTRLLLEWCRRHGGLYAVADQSAAEVQRRYLAEALAQRFPGFADVDYRDWRGLLSRLSTEAQTFKWRGPIVFDEFPYWIASSPELPSVLQRWIDHEAREAGLVVAVAGSSQRMMQGLALGREAPLYGRAREIFAVLPLEVPHVLAAIGRVAPRDVIEFYTAWGGVPRYWELAVEMGGDTRTAIHDLVLDPRGPLHREPDRLLLEELPSALEVRPVLDAIGAGAHRVSEIAGRIGRPATSLSRPLDRLIELGLVVREVPFGEAARTSRRSLYQIADPFTRLWFRAVAPHRAELVSGTRQSRRAVLERHWERLVSVTWEQLCRQRLPAITHRSLGAPGEWKPASRWWARAAPEWDIVAEDVAGKRLLIGEVKLATRDHRTLVERVGRRPPPDLPSRYRRHTVVRALFVPDAQRVARTGDVAIVTVKDLVGGWRR